MISTKLLPPRKFKITKYFAYNPPKTNFYRLGDTKGNYVGYMLALPDYVENEAFYPNISNYFSFYIKRILIDKDFRKQGAGKALLKIAAKESYRKGCDGKVHLIAGRLNSLETKLPHKFYWKNHFRSSDEPSNKKIKQAIENNSDIPSYMGLGTPMYLDI